MKEIFKKYKAVVFFDTETTGLDADTCQIIELAAIRIEQNTQGELCNVYEMDMFVKLPEGQKIPEKITQLTGITDEILESKGVSEGEAAAIFGDIIRNDEGPVLLVAHNAQFDLLFVRELLVRNPFYIASDYGENMTLSNRRRERLEAADYLDSLTVYKDRRPYPHKLANAIAAYNLEDKVKNSHRAIDDVEALIEVCKAMYEERADLLYYVNLFGYNPRYGVNGRRLDGVNYWPQRFNKFMQASRYTLPEHCIRGGSMMKRKNILKRFKYFWNSLNWKEHAVLVLLAVAALSITCRVITNATEQTNDGACVEATEATEAEQEKRYEITEAERWELASVITAEAEGEPFAGKVAVAQCILQACEDDDLRPGEVFKEYKYSKARPKPCEEALEAVAAVFDSGHIATKEPIKYFYSPELDANSWHESQVHVLTINGHKFFKEAKE